MTDELTVKIVTAESADILHVAGSLDGKTFEKFNQVLEERFRNNRHRLILDLHRVRHMTSTGLGVLVCSLHRTGQNSGMMVLLNPSAAVQHVLNLVNLAECMPLVYDLDSALRMCSQPATPAAQ